MMKWPRRFCCQHASVGSRQNGDSLPLLTTATRSRRDPEAHQVVADRVAAAIAEAEVVFGRAALVAVPFNGDPRRRPPLHPLGVLLQHGTGVVANRRLVEIEDRRRPRSSAFSCSSVLRLKISSSLSAAGRRRSAAAPEVAVPGAAWLVRRAVAVAPAQEARVSYRKLRRRH